MAGYTDRDGFVHDHAPKDRSAVKRCPGCKAASQAAAVARAAVAAGEEKRNAEAESIRLASVITDAKGERPRAVVRRFEFQGRTFAALPEGRGFQMAVFVGCDKYAPVAGRWDFFGEIVADANFAADEAADRFLNEAATYYGE